MPDRSSDADRQDRREIAGDGYFAYLAQGTHLLLTTFRPRGAPVSARVQGIAEGDRAYFRVRSRSARPGTSGGRAGSRCWLPRAMRWAWSLRIAAVAAVRPLSGEEASRAAEKLARTYPVKRRFLARLPHRSRVHYELTAP